VCVHLLRLVVLQAVNGACTRAHLRLVDARAVGGVAAEVVQRAGGDGADVGGGRRVLVDLCAAGCESATALTPEAARSLHNAGDIGLTRDRA
jgi:hypothetical protein